MPSCQIWRREKQTVSVEQLFYVGDDKVPKSRIAGENRYSYQDNHGGTSNVLFRGPGHGFQLSQNLDHTFAETGSSKPTRLTVAFDVPTALQKLDEPFDDVLTHDRCSTPSCVQAKKKSPLVGPDCLYTIPRPACQCLTAGCLPQPAAWLLSRLIERTPYGRLNFAVRACSSVVVRASA